MPRPIRSCTWSSTDAHGLLYEVPVTSSSKKKTSPCSPKRAEGLAVLRSTIRSVPDSPQPTALTHRRWPPGLGRCLISMQQATSEPVHAPPTRGVGHPAEALSDPDALAATIRITGGNLRLVQRLFAQINRIAEINDLETPSPATSSTPHASHSSSAPHNGPPWPSPAPVGARGGAGLGGRRRHQAVSPPGDRGRRARRNRVTPMSRSVTRLSNRAI